MAGHNLWLLVTLLSVGLQLACATDETPSALLPLEARNAESNSGEEDVISTSYVLPNQIFNDGKPYYAGKDSISGQIDFSAKKPAGIEPEFNEVLDPKEKIILTGSSPNIHDFLNLPVKYSSSKFVYPLVSSSYANLKYQGSNKNYITNKKPTSVIAPGTPPPLNYHSSNYYTVPTTKLMAVPPTAPDLFSSSSSSSTSTTTTSTTTTTTTTSKKPTTTTTVSTTPSTTQSTTPTPLPTAKYTTTTRRPLPISTTTPAPRTSTTRKKFVPTKKYTPTTTTSSTATTPMRFPDERRPVNTTAPPRPTTTSVFTTHHPTPQSAIFPTEGTSTTKVFTSSTGQPVVFTEDPTPPPAFSPIPNTRIPDLDPADVYHTLGQKNNAQQNQLQHQQQQQQQQQQPQTKPPMTLADIFNSLAEEESAVAATNYQQNQGFDAQGNLIEPIAPSRPSPFAMQGLDQQQQPERQGTRPPLNNVPQQTQQSNKFPPQQQLPQPQTQQQQLVQQQQIQQQQIQQQQMQQQQLPYLPQQSHDMQVTNEQKVISGSQENFGNEYVSYQVQQPNVMQYRPAPGAINNVVISPGQNLASFVLGSQQQVGPNAFASNEKQPLFSKDTPVQYGTVINEDINNIKRPQPAGNYSPTQQAGAGSHHPQQQQPPSPAFSNFHQNGNFGVGSTAPAASVPSNAGLDIYQEPPPEPPSPYQQLPLIGSNLRPSKPSQKPKQPQAKPELQQQQHHTNYQLTPPSVAPQSGFPPGASPLVLEQNNNGQQQQHQQQQHQQQQHQQQQPQQPSSNDLHGQDTQELLVSTNIRFPANEEESIEGASPPLIPGPSAGSQVNGHAQPLSLQQLQNTNPVVFPKPKDEASNKLGDELGDVQFQQHEVLTMNQHKQKLNYPQQAEQSAPSQNMEPPPRFPPALPNNAQSSPQANRPNGPPPFAYNEYTRKPIPGITRPNSDRNLPNILPQFRPNAKLSSGHPPNFNQEPGNIRIPGQPTMKRPHQSPQFAHRRQPLMQQQKRYPMNRISEYPPPPSPQAGDANRRVYRLPPYGGQGVPYLDRMYPHPRPVQQHGYLVERHAPGSNTDSYKTIAHEKLSDFEEEDLVINDPPQPVTPSKERPQTLDETKLEPVVTLQMLQSQKKAVTLPNDDTGAGEIQVPADGDNEDDEAENAENVPDSQDGLYVVYPMKGSKKDTTEAGSESKDPLPAVAHIEAPTGSDYQNTPFSVIRDQPQEPILTVKNKKPISLQQQTKTQPLKEKFPYPIEKPDPSYTELHPDARVPGVLIAPRIINGAYGTGTEAPIAIAYTPTEPNPYPYGRVGQDDGKFSNVNLATSVINEIRSDTQTEEGLSNDFDLRGQNFEKDFMAPFYPSVSLGSAANTPANSWNILPSTTDQSVFEKNNINRADVDADEQKEPEDTETTTKSFELDRFQPELQGGFKPIYPPGYKHEDLTEETEYMQPNESNNMPLALASRMDPSTIHSASTNKPEIDLAVTTTTTTPRPQISTTKSVPNAEANNVESNLSSTSAPVVAQSSTPAPQKKKSTFETSLAALLFGDDEEELEDEARKGDVKAKSGPRTIPRMGPRSLKLS